VDLGATYDDHLRLVLKHVGDFLLVLIKLFFASCYGWGATSDYRFKIETAEMTYKPAKNPVNYKRSNWPIFRLVIRDWSLSVGLCMQDY